MPDSFYETDKVLSEYLLFHYGKPDEVLPRQHLVRFAVVEQQVFGEHLVRLVKTVGHQIESR